MKSPETWTPQYTVLDDLSEPNPTVVARNISFCFDTHVRTHSSGTLNRLLCYFHETIMPRATAITIGYLVLHYLIVSISATILCTPGNPVQGDSFCAENYREGSICSQDGTCSNPFRSGCLKAVLSEQTQFRNLLRTCNSRDDPSARANGECLDTGNVFEFYNEVRILGQNWEAPMLTSWILQIMLSEFLGVPTTLESGKPESEASIDFYDPLLRFSYGETYVSGDSMQICD